MKRLYLSGKITGTDDYMLRFAAAEKRFERDYEIINPVKTSATLPELSHDQYMAIGLTLLPMCDAIFMMRGWKGSEGALEEYREACYLGLEVIYEQ